MGNEVSESASAVSSNSSADAVHALVSMACSSFLGREST